MSNNLVDVIVFFGDHARSGTERVVADGCAAAALDLIDLALACPYVGRVAVATNDAGFAARLENRERVVVEVDAPGEPFHFGHRLRDVVERHGIRRPLYFGAGSAPLLGAESLADLCRRLLEGDRLVVTNNRASADYYGFTPGEALRRIPLPGDQDNHIPYLLAQQGGLRPDVLETTIESTFDIDTPTDLAVLAVQSKLGPNLRAYLERVRLDTRRLEAAMPLLLGRHTQVTLAGRVNTGIWGKTPNDIPGPKRIYAEERNMKSFGRDVRGEARTLLGDLYQALGAQRFFARLAGYSDVVFFDTRVLFAHLGLRLSPAWADRFASDLGDVDAIADPVVRELTAAALACPVPVILGGHNIVAGALWALVQEAWDRADAGLIAPTS